MRKETQKSLQVNSQSWLNAIILHKHKHQGEVTASCRMQDVNSSSRHINSPHLYLCCCYVILLM